MYSGLDELFKVEVDERSVDSTMLNVSYYILCICFSMYERIPNTKGSNCEV